MSTTSLSASVRSCWPRPSNTGPEPLIRSDVAALKRDRLSWVSQNYIRDQTLIAANAALVSAQNRSALARLWGGGEVASADGPRSALGEVYEASIDQQFRSGGKTGGFA